MLLRKYESAPNGSVHKGPVKSLSAHGLCSAGAPDIDAPKEGSLGLGMVGHVEDGRVGGETNIC